MILCKVIQALAIEQLGASSLTSWRISGGKQNQDWKSKNTLFVLTYAQSLKPPKHMSHVHHTFLKLVSVGFLSSFASKSAKIKAFTYHLFTAYFIMPYSLYFRIFKVLVVCFFSWKQNSVQFYMNSWSIWINLKHYFINLYTKKFPLTGNW